MSKIDIRLGTELKICGRDVKVERGATCHGCHLHDKPLICDTLACSGSSRSDGIDVVLASTAEPDDNDGVLELKVGEFLGYADGVCQVVEGQACEECVFFRRSLCLDMRCTGDSRDDRTHILFKKVTDEVA